MSGRWVCTAPGRANLIGNPSDQYGGCTLACSVPLRARVVLRAAEPGGLETAGRFAPVDEPAHLALRGDLFDVGRAVLAWLDMPRPGCHIAYESEIPLRSGLAGSTALVVALLRALQAWAGRECDPYTLAESAREVERTRLGVQCGYVDQYMCVFGGLRYVDFRGKQIDVDATTAPFATVESLDAWGQDLPFWLAFTGVRHSSDSVHRPIRERWLAGDRAVRAAYERVTELGLLGKRALLERRWAALGALMNENHAIQRDLGGSGRSNEGLIAAALGAGAPGAKLAGAGDGGTVAVLWPDADPAPLERALRQAGAAAIYRPRAEPGVRLTREGHGTDGP